MSSPVIVLGWVTVFGPVFHLDLYPSTPVNSAWPGHPRLQFLVIVIVCVLCAAFVA